MMSNTIRLLVFWVAISVMFFQVSTPCYGFEIAIDVAPSVLNLQNNGQVVTVHTDIAYNAVNSSTVYLNGIAIDSWKADDRGNFVAKFLIEEVKSLPGLIVGGYNTLELVGATIDGEEFTGTQDIKVVKIVPKK